MLLFVQLSRVHALLWVVNSSVGATVFLGALVNTLFPVATNTIFQVTAVTVNVRYLTRELRRFSDLTINDNRTAI